MIDGYLVRVNVTTPDETVKSFYMDFAGYPVVRLYHDLNCVTVFSKLEVAQRHMDKLTTELKWQFRQGILNLALNQDEYPVVIQLVHLTGESLEVLKAKVVYEITETISR